MFLVYTKQIFVMMMFKTVNENYNKYIIILIIWCKSMIVSEVHGPQTSGCYQVVHVVSVLCSHLQSYSGFTLRCSCFVTSINIVKHFCVFSILNYY